jgi:hypothetical protein
VIYINTFNNLIIGKSFENVIYETTKVYFSFLTFQFNFENLPFAKNSSQAINGFITDSDYWEGFDGSIGLGYSRDSKDISFENFVKLNYDYYQMYAFDFVSPDAKLVLGPALESSKEYPLKNVIWSEIQFKNTFWYNQNTGSPPSFMLYNLMFCDANILSNYSSNWPATINTLVEGVGVPEEFYWMIKSWINNQNFTSNEFNPLLEFQLSSNEKDFKFQIPISNLYDNQTNNLLLFSTGKMKYHFSNKNGVPLGEPSIQIGTKFLERYYTVVDMKSYRIGIYPTKYETSNSKCQSNEKKCMGLQVYYEASNVCIDPPCSNYFFQQMDQVTKQCVFRVEIYFIFGFIVSVLATMEMVLYGLYKRISRNLEVE